MPGLKEQICRVLADEGPLHWGDLAAHLPGDRSDAELERVVSELQNEGRIRHRGRSGGYRLSAARSPAVGGSINPSTAETATGDVMITVAEMVNSAVTVPSRSATVTVEIDSRRLGGDEE